MENKNKLGLHANSLVAGWSRDEAEYAVRKTAELGYDLIELPGLLYDVIDTAHTRKLLNQHSLSATMSLGLSDAEDISSTDKERVARGEAVLHRVVEVGHELGVSLVCGIVHSAFQKNTVAPTAEGIKNSADVLARVCEAAKPLGIEIGLEVVNRYETNLLNTAAQGVQLCKMIGASNASVHLDSYHMNIEESDTAAAIEATGSNLGYFHIGESHRGYLGSGSIDFRSMFRALVRSGYTGPITFESFSSEVVGPQIAGILAVWRNTWDDGEDLSRHALEFIKAELKSAYETVYRVPELVRNEDMADG